MIYKMDIEWETKGDPTVAECAQVVFLENNSGITKQQALDTAKEYLQLDDMKAYLHREVLTYRNLHHKHKM